MPYQNLFSRFAEHVRGHLLEAVVFFILAVVGGLAITQCALAFLKFLGHK